MRTGQYPLDLVNWRSIVTMERSVLSGLRVKARLEGYKVRVKAEGKSVVNIETYKLKHKQKEK